MSLLNKLGEISRTVGDKTSTAIEINRRNGKIKAEKAAISRTKAELGALYWEKHLAGAQLDEDGAALCQKIQANLDEIARLEEEIRRIREEAERKPEPAPPALADGEGTFCPACGTRLGPGMEVCPACGSTPAPAERICPACGAAVAAAAGSTCPECGGKL